MTAAVDEKGVPPEEMSAQEWTFLFTDIEGSTRLWEKYPEPMRVALARHDTLFRNVAQDWGGDVFKTIGDAFCIAFPSSATALGAAIDAQYQLEAESWGAVGKIRVRMALYRGVAEQRDGDYFGTVLNRVARLRDAAHGGQVIVASCVLEGLPCTDPASNSVFLPHPHGAQNTKNAGEGILAFARDRGFHRLKDIAEPERIYQIVAPGLPEDFPALRTLSTHPHNLSPPLGPFIGREKEQRTVLGLLTDSSCRLLTLTGPGGTGKTQLASQIARMSLERYPDGVWFADLSALTDPRDVMPTVAHACGLPDEAHHTFLEQLCSHFASARALLVLDNFEQVEDAADDVGVLLRACQHLQILVTSRILLDLSMEFEYAVPPLSEEDAVSLFATRARQARLDFALDDVTRPDVVALCAALEGLPLSVELAAAQVRSLPLATIRETLGNRLETLRVKTRDILPRHRSLRAAIDWSYDLLEEEARRLFRRLSVFAGGFAEDAVAAVCDPEAPPGEIESTLILLRDSSLLREDEMSTPEEEGMASRRFRMLDTLRAYGKERLEETGASPPFHQAHFDWFYRQLRDASPEFHGDKQTFLLRRLDVDYDNLRAALHWAAESKSEKGSSDAESEGGLLLSSLRFANALRHYWEVRGYFREGREWLEASAARVSAPLTIRTNGDRALLAEKAKALTNAGVLAWYQSEYEAAQRLQEASLIVCETLGDRQTAARVRGSLADVYYVRGDREKAHQLHGANLPVYRASGEDAALSDTLAALGNIAYIQGDLEEATQLYEEGFTAAQRLKDLRREGVQLNNLGNVAYRRGDFAAARALYEQNRERRVALGDRRGMALSLNNLAATATETEDFAGALTYYHQCLPLFQELDDRRVLAFSLSSYAQCLSRLSRTEEAVRALGAATALSEAADALLDPEGAEAVRVILTEARAALGDAAFEAAWAAGRATPTAALLAELCTATG